MTNYQRNITNSTGLTQNFRHIITSTFSLTSIACLLYIIYCITKTWKYTIQMHLIRKVVYWMAVCQLLFTSSLLFELLPMMVGKHSFWSNIHFICQILNFIYTFTGIATSFWFCAITWMTLMLLLGYSSTWITRRMCYQHTVVWSLAFLLTTCRFILSPFGLNGVVPSVGCFYNEHGNFDQLFFFSPILFAMLFSAIVLCITIYRYNTFGIFYFVGCFITLWILPSSRLMFVLLYGSAPAWLTYGSEFSFSISGMVNFYGLVVNCINSNRTCNPCFKTNYSTSNI